MVELIVINLVDLSVADAVVGEVKDGKFFYAVDETVKEGTMPTQTLSPDNENVLAGYYAATTLSAVDGDLVTGSIKSGITLFGVAGHTDVRNVSDADALLGEVIEGATFYALGGARKTGTMPTVAIVAANDDYPAGYHVGNVGGLDAIDVDLAPGNIKSGVTIFGKLGTFVSTLAQDTIGSDEGGAMAHTSGTYARTNFGFSIDRNMAEKTLTFDPNSRAIGVAWGHASVYRSAGVTARVKVVMAGVVVGTSSYFSSTTCMRIARGTRALSGSQTTIAYIYAPDSNYWRSCAVTTASSNEGVGVAVGSIKTT